MVSDQNLLSLAPVSIIIPAFNEQDGIGDVIADIRTNFIEANNYPADAVELLVIDDGSTDATAQRARQAGASIISHPGNLGYGASLKTGLRAAKHELVIITDADGTYAARYMEPLLREIEQCDMAVGMRSGGKKYYPWVRRPAKWILVRTATYLAEKPIPDLNSGLRVFRKKDAMRFINLCPSGFSFTTTITLAYLSSDLLVRYVPIDYQPRVGRSKIRPLRDTKNLFLTIVRSIFFFNPLRVCVPLALILVLIAIYLLIFVRDSHGNVLDGTVSVLLISAVQFVISGLIADIIARTR
jgi:glycosyltransferase involved in cell wall biosynthesis